MTTARLEPATQRVEGWYPTTKLSHPPAQVEANVVINQNRVIQVGRDQIQNQVKYNQQIFFIGNSDSPDIGECDILTMNCWL